MSAARIGRGMVDPARTRIIVSAATRFSNSTRHVGQKPWFGHARRRRRTANRFSGGGGGTHCFLLCGFRLKAARTAVCSHDHEQGANCPCVSLHEAPGQMVQKATSRHRAQRGEESLKRIVRRCRSGSPFLQMAASGASRTFPHRHEKELHGMTSPAGETQSVVIPAWQTGPFARAARAWSVSALESGVDFRSKNSLYSTESSIIWFREMPEWPGTMMLAGFTANPLLSPSSIAEKTSSKWPWNMGDFA